MILEVEALEDMVGEVIGVGEEIQDLEEIIEVLVEEETIEEDQVLAVEVLKVKRVMKKEKGKEELVLGEEEIEALEAEDPVLGAVEEDQVLGEEEILEVVQDIVLRAEEKVEEEDKV